MKILTSKSAVITERQEWIGKSVGFVPTMGGLHAGHMSLCQRAQNENDIVVVTLFVNPTQFNVADDYVHYPRPLVEDTEMLAKQKIDYLFTPTVKEMYPDEYDVLISEEELSSELEGKYRPGHFSGVQTIIAKFLNLLQPNRLYLGEKDYQQLLIIKKMLAALFFNTEVVPCETIRAPDGLALSSRNARLTKEQRQRATHFPQILKSHLPIDEIKKALMTAGFKVDYVVEKWHRKLAAVWVDNIRLIDNVLKE